MADSYLVQINMEKLRANLSKAENREWTKQMVKDMLKEEKFIERPYGWLCEELQLDFLDRSEIISRRRI